MLFLQHLRLAFLLVFASASLAYPDTGRLITLPPRSQDTGLKGIPDEDHPFIAPGPSDLRGPCPGLNTLANHGYIPRNGIATFEEIVTAVGEGFNMERDLAAALTAFGILGRGNSFTNQISIGGPTPDIPALPDGIDGNQTKGLATHGRFEGDVSMTRRDAAVGDNKNLDPALFDQLVNAVETFGNGSDVTGPKSVVNVHALAEFKFERYVDSVQNDPELEFHPGRLSLSYGEASFTLNFFANGTTNVLSIPTLTSIFVNQTFPSNWHRRSTPADLNAIVATAGEVLALRPVAPGANIGGAFVPDVVTDPCILYNDLASNNVPAVLMTTTGVLKENVDFLLDVIHDLFPNCPFKEPVGEAGV